MVILDRDGTINFDPGWFGRDPDWHKQLRLLDGVVEGIKRLNLFAKVIVASNQFGVARGYFSLETILDINKEIDKLLRAAGAIIDNWQICPFVDFDWASKQGLDLNTPWVVKDATSLRKPSIGMLDKAAKELGIDYTQHRIFAIGNRFDDAAMGVNAGGCGIIIKDEKYINEFEKVKVLSLTNNKYAAVDVFSAAVDKIEGEIRTD